jgi:hypothetical protein
MSDPKQTLKDELEQERREKEWAETWTPDEPGDMLIGTLTGYDEAETDFGTYTVAHIRDEEGVLRGLWLMHSVLQDEWSEADPGRGERVGVQYLGKRSGSNFDYHVWTVKVDRPATERDRSEEEPQDTAGNDRPPQESERDPKSGAEGGAKETAPGFDGSDLYGEPASKQSAADAEGETPEDAGGESTLDDPNGGLPF